MAVRDQNIVTASGLGTLEFTVEIFNELGLADQEILTTWYKTLKHGEYSENAE